ncbi:hypothetical protein [Streptomyces sp. NBC_01483]|uniref:hypothetical protein n=1 Tax=Streptomyces sp. NBC_01483 TaxID=2903883 RepID=UPI002E35B7B4|nr:hypothetical protein [Streptomyces sp. NBC_01483]
MTADFPQELADKLSRAGFTFLEVVETRDDLVPYLVARYVTYLQPEDGRSDVIIEHDEPNLGARFNAEWERAAQECGLFSTASDGRREFLLGLDISADAPDAEDEENPPSYRWVRVLLRDEWDIAGVGCANGVLGSGENNPTFAATSLSGDVVMVAGYWQVGIGFTLASHPERIATLREHAKRIASYEHVEPAQRQWAERWLAHSQAR